MIGAILAGGASRRFAGRPKGLEEVGGVRLIEYVARALRAVVPEIILVSNAPDATQWLSEARVCRDVRTAEGRSSLIGIHAALVHAGGPVLVVAWDMPFVSPELLRLILDRAQTARYAVLPESDRGLEPCCAWYGPAALPTIDAMLDVKELRLERLADRLPACDRVTRADVAAVGDPARLFFNVNTAGDLARAESMADLES